MGKYHDLSDFRLFEDSFAFTSRRVAKTFSNITLEIAFRAQLALYKIPILKAVHSSCYMYCSCPTTSQFSQNF